MQRLTYPTILCLLFNLFRYASAGLGSQVACASTTSLSSQSGYCYSDTQSASAIDTPVHDWNITLVDEMEIIKPALSHGLYLMSTNYTIDDHHYDVELFEKDCRTTPTGPTNFPIMFYNTSNSVTMNRTNNIELLFLYNQTIVQESSLWESNRIGGTVEFCIRFNNYLSENPPGAYYIPLPGSDPFDIQVNHFEVTYTISVNSMSDFEVDDLIGIERKGADNARVDIDYEEEITAYICDDAYNMVSTVYTQGDYVNICVETVDRSAFEVHSIKDLTVSQWDATGATPNLLTQFNYVISFEDSPLSLSDCMYSNTTSAICKTKIQLIANWFDHTRLDMSGHFLRVVGTVKMDYLGRRMSVNVPISLRIGGQRTVDSSGSIRRLNENSESSSFNTIIQIQTIEEAESSTNSFGDGGYMLPFAVAILAGLFSMI